MLALASSCLFLVIDHIFKIKYLWNIKMSYIVVGGVKAEINASIKSETVVEIGPEDIINNDSDSEEDPFNTDDDHQFVHENPHMQQLDQFKISQESSLQRAKMDISSDKDKHIIRKGKNDKDLKCKNDLQTKEKLILNYTENEDLLSDDDPELVNNDTEIKKLQAVKKKVYTRKSWSETYRTAEGTPIDEDHAKIKRNPVPISYVLPTEYKQEEIDKFRCTHCQFVTSRQQYITKHIRYNHRTLTSTFECPYCPFTSKYYPRDHIISKHKSEQELTWFRCSQCDYKSKLKGKLIHHMISHLDPIQMMDRMKKCDRCPKAFKEVDTLNRHIRLKHEGHKLKTLKCSECEYETTVRAQLHHHIQLWHTDLETLTILQCSKCTFETKIKQKLVSHMTTRHRSKILCEKCPYQCDQIDTMKLHLISHKETKDDADLKYRCDKCDYKTYRCYSLQVHKLNHLKPEEIQYFYCHHCSFKAKRKDNLKTHVLRHFKQNDVTFACYICDFTTKKRHMLINHIDKHSRGIDMDTEESVLLEEPSKPKKIKITKRHSTVRQSIKRKNRKFKVKSCSGKQEGLKNNVNTAGHRPTEEPRAEVTSALPTDVLLNKTERMITRSKTRSLNLE